MRQRTCKVCRTKFKPHDSFQWWCSPACGTELAMKKVEQKRKKEEVARRKQAAALRRQQKAERERAKPLTQLCSEAQTEVNRYIRARDRNNGCISCGSPDVDDAGHFIHAGSKYRTSRLRFDERVIHGQCARCNRFAGGGNNAEFREGLIHRYGEQYVNEIDQLKQMADRGDLPPLDKDEVREIKRTFARRAREIEKHE